MIQQSKCCTETVEVKILRKTDNNFLNYVLTTHRVFAPPVCATSDSSGAATTITPNHRHVDEVIRPAELAIDVPDTRLEA